MFAEARNYIACCPSGYQFHPPDKTVDSDRPAYGGTCYSDLPANTNIPVIAYDETGDTASKAFSASTSGAQAYAHPMDGWALTSPTMVGCPTSSTSLASSDSSSDSSSLQSSSASSPASPQEVSPSPSATSSDSGPSTGAIVGASIGGCAALALLIGLVWFLLVRRRKNSDNAIPKDAHHIADDFGGPKTYYRSEAPTGYNNHEIGAATHYPPEKAEWRPRQVNDGHGPIEMAAYHATELPVDAKQDGDAKVMGFYGR
ncbi:hypothetical protein N0V90_000847 [Kalmusia sp. IMI 367209]|nr:hypothetical protein N0V90_000847 [Kalmusia sp. IMI 367209]